MGSLEEKKKDKTRTQEFDLQQDTSGLFTFCRSMKVCLQIHQNTPGREAFILQRTHPAFSCVGFKHSLQCGLSSGVDKLQPDPAHHCLFGFFILNNVLWEHSQAYSLMSMSDVFSMADSTLLPQNRAIVMETTWTAKPLIWPFAMNICWFLLPTLGQTLCISMYPIILGVHQGR